MKNVVLWDGAGLGCFGILAVGGVAILVAAVIGAALQFLLQPVIAIPLAIICAILAGVGLTSSIQEKAACRNIINEFGTASQKERLSAGYIDVVREASELLVAIAFAPLFERGFQRYPSDAPVIPHEKTAATDADYAMLKQVTALFPQAAIKLIQIPQPFRPQSPEYQTGVEVFGTWYGVTITTRFQPPRSNPIT